MANPADDATADAIAYALQRPVLRRVAPASEIERWFDRLYGTAAPANPQPPAAPDAAQDLDRLRDLASDAPVIRLVNRWINQAVEAGASDIHIEPQTAPSPRQCAGAMSISASRSSPSGAPERGAARPRQRRHPAHHPRPRPNPHETVQTSSPTLSKLLISRFQGASLLGGSSAAPSRLPQPTPPGDTKIAHNDDRWRLCRPGIRRLLR